ncbi:MAG: phosphate ABC transporter substrate-binding protein PstS [Nocardioidaceae bacterium]
MRSNSLRHAALMGTASLTVAFSLAACGAANENTVSTGASGSNALSGDLNGAGSTAQEAAMQAWKAGFQSANPDVTVNYDAIGSGGGREQFLAGSVQFAGSDAYLTSDELASAKKTCGGNPIEVPVYVSPIAIVYNLPGVSGLKLRPQTLAAIFAGKITTWNDNAIAADNPGVKLPTATITPVHRSDESGTTENFTDYLSQTAGTTWTAGAVQTWPIKGGEASDGTSGVISSVTNGAGTIGYADASQAGGLSKALIGVGSHYVAPTASAASAVLDESSPVQGRASTDLAIAVNRTTAKTGVYPIVLVSYQLSCSTYASQATVDLVKGFESYVISQAGQAAAAKQAGSAPITASIRAKAQTAIDSISVR